MRRTVSDSYAEINRQILELADAYRYEPWRVRIIDMQRASVQFPNPPVAIVPKCSNTDINYFTLVMQANGFTFTTSELTSIGSLSHKLTSPYGIEQSDPDGDTSSLIVSYDGNPIPDFGSIHLREIMGKPSAYYFPYKDTRSGQPLSFYLIVNPYENCAFRCKYCSRLPYFKTPAPSIQENIQLIISNILAVVQDPDEVKFINIITGSFPNPEQEMTFLKEVITAFNKAGFVESEFGVYTSQIYSRHLFEQLRDLGVIFFTVTLEATSSDARSRLHARRNPKRARSFEQTLDTISVAEDVFPFVSTTMMLGYEQADEVKRNLGRLAKETRSTVNHYIPRVWLPGQLDLLHPSATNLKYFVDLFNFIERNVNVGRMTSNQLFEERFLIPRFAMRYRS